MMSDESFLPTEPGTTLQALLQLRHLTLDARELSLRGLTGLPGKVQSRRRGNGLDFDDLRRYQPGDDVRHIDWNVTARTQQPHIRLYREDRERAITVVVDLRSSMFTGSDCYLADRAMRFAALSLWQASRNGDRCAAVVFDETGIHSSRPRIADRGALEALGMLSARYAEAVQNAGHAASLPLSTLLAHLNQCSRLAGSLLLFSGLHDPGDDIDVQLAISGGKRALSVVEITDPLEHDGLPPGLYPYQHRGNTALAALTASDARTLRDTLRATLAVKRAPWQTHLIPLLDPDPQAAGFLRALQQRGLL